MNKAGLFQNKAGLSQNNPCLLTSFLDQAPNVETKKTISLYYHSVFHCPLKYSFTGLFVDANKYRDDHYKDYRKRHIVNLQTFNAVGECGMMIALIHQIPKTDEV